MRKHTIEKKVEKSIYVIEMTIAVLLALGIVIGLADLVKYFIDIFNANQADSYDLFQAFLGHALILIVGVELVLMILYHSTKAILELVLFVIARKMLIYSNTMIDLVFGTMAIGIVFLILKFLIQDDDGVISKRDRFSYSATTRIRDISSQTGLEMPTDRGTTVGSLVCSLAEEACKPVEKDAEFHSGDIKIKVTKLSEKGEIEEVIVSSDKEYKRRRIPFHKRGVE